MVAAERIRPLSCAGWTKTHADLTVDTCALDIQ
jgi:hypothetical protein